MNLLDRARNLLNGLAAPGPARVQSYHVSCPEGHRLRGERTEGYQALRCPTCGEGLFILPRSPLPEPVAPASTARPRRAAAPATAALGAASAFEAEEGPIALTDPPPPPEVAEPEPEPEPDAEIQWMDEGPPTPAPVAPSPRPAPARRPAKPRPKEDRPKDPRPRPAHAASATVTAPTVPRERFSEWARRRRNPLIFLGVAALVLGTIGLRVWRSRRQDLPRIAELARTKGLPALDEGKFDVANQLLAPGKVAVDTLGGAVEGADAIRQGADEAAIYSGLLSERLEAILAEAAGHPNPAEWPSRFDTLYKGRSYVFDADIAAVPDADGNGRYDLDYRIFQDGGGGTEARRFGRIDLAGFRLIERQKPAVGDRVTFGARLASFTFDPESGEWRVGLEPDSGVFLTHPKALQSIGWRAPSDEPAGENP